MYGGFVMLRRKSLAFVSLVMILSFFLHGQNVSATSIHDNTYKTTDDLILEKDQWCPNMPATQDYATTYLSYLLDESKWHPQDQLNPNDSFKPFKDSFLAALNDTEYGTWGVSKFDGDSNGTPNNGITIFWTQNPTASLQWDHYSIADMVSVGSVYSIEIKCNHASYGTQYDHFFGPSIRRTGGFRPISRTASYHPQSVKNLFLFSSNPNFTYNYPIGYTGSLIQGQVPDIDGDGLDMAEELAQGTSEGMADTDGDGLSDYVESTLYPNRTSVFCGIPLCAYPDPLVKDVYVELDWMNDTADSRVLKPSGAQLTYVQDMFDDKNAKLHIDTGQYGGGNALPLYIHDLRIDPTLNVADFGDFKDGGDGITANFAANRHSIWKYMIYGYGYIKSGDPNYPAISGSSGLAEVSGDDIFVAGGIVEDSTGLVSLDRAVANTIAHEIGHTLCLSLVQIYQEQNAGCVYNGIDNDSYKPENYLSVMNYRYQLTDDDDMGVVDYSDGTNGSGDHDDWNGVFAGMRDFNGTQTQLGSKRVFAKNKTMDPDKIVQEVVLVAADNENRQQKANSPFLASIQQPLDPPRVSGVAFRPNARVSNIKSQSPDWTPVLMGAGGLAVLSTAITLLWHLRRKL